MRVRRYPKDFLDIVDLGQVRQNTDYLLSYATLKFFLDA